MSKYLVAMVTPRAGPDFFADYQIHFANAAGAWHPAPYSGTATGYC